MGHRKETTNMYGLTIAIARNLVASYLTKFYTAEEVRHISVSCLVYAYANREINIVNSGMIIFVMTTSAII